MNRQFACSSGIRRLPAIVLFVWLVALARAPLPATGVAPELAGQGTVPVAPPAPGTLDAMVSSLPWRNMGPALPSGRTNDIAVAEGQTSTIYVATATGGAWKTTTNGTVWTPVFDRERTSALGAIAVSPANPSLVWVGTGEAWNARLSRYGDGVYRSQDGGSTWKNVGLSETRYVGRIIVHPEQPDTVYVAALGSLWGPNAERGLFKTIDGGRTWQKVLFISNHTGVVDVAMDPRNPDRLYAAAYQRERRAWNFVGGGPEGGLYRSADAGVTWEKITEGLPTGDIGRIALSVCRSSPNIVYAAVEAGAGQGGVFRSSDYGASWEVRTKEVMTRSDFGQIRCDANNPDRVYLLYVRLYRSEDGARTFRSDVFGSTAHGDWRGLWIDPANSNHLVAGSDGGVYSSYDAGRTWDFMTNLPVSQFYAVGADMQEPFYYVYGGLQDNGTFGGPSGTRETAGITNADWFRTTGGDGFYALADPTDPTVVYSESQNGALYRVDTRTGERRAIQPQPPEGRVYRWGWSAPLLISQHDHNTLYFAANVVFRSRNRGDSWEVISPDLTRQLDPYQLPIMGRTWPRDSVAFHQGTADYGNISSLSESHLKSGLLAVGTDDGVIQITEDDGRSWTKIEKFPGVPDRAWVSRVVLSGHAERTLYATFDAHRDSDFRPFVLRSSDLGRTWKPIAGDLPEGTVQIVLEDPRNPDVLYAGTDFGAFVSLSAGSHWTRFSALPTVPVHDMLIHPRQNDLVVATHGRGIWILDDVAILQELTPGVQNGEAHLAQVRPATAIRRFARTWGSEGDREFAAPNPPDGAVITYYVNPSVMKAARSGTDASPRAGVPAEGVSVEIRDARGTTVRRLEPPQGPRGAGIQRLVWDLRHALPYDVSPADAAGDFRRSSRGPLVLPGVYTVRLTVGPSVLDQTVTVKDDPAITLSEAERRVWHDTLIALSRVEGTAREATTAAEQLHGQLDAAQRAADGHLGASLALREEARSLAKEVDGMVAALRGGGRGRAEAEQQGVLPIAGQLRQLYAAIEASTAPPTADQQRLLRRSTERLAEQVAKLNRIVTEGMPALNASLTRAGVRWTPGRPIQMPAIPAWPW